MVCRDPEVQLACFTPSDVLVDAVSVLHVTVYDSKGRPSASYYQDDTGAIINPATYLGGGVASIGQCQAVVEPCSDYVSLGTLYFLSGNDGQVRNREWHDTVPSVSINNSTTAHGRMVRENHDFSLPTTVDALTSSLALNDTDNTAGETDVQVLEGFITVPLGGIYLRYSGVSEGYWALELAECCGDYEVIDELGYADRDPVNGSEINMFVPEGVHGVRFWNIDSGGSNSSLNLSYSNDGVTYTNDNTPPDSAFVKSSIKPVEECVSVIKCKDDGTLLNALTDEPYLVEDLTVCPQICVADKCCNDCLECG